MQRRKFLATVGSLTAASAVGVGTSAFEGMNVTTDREVTVSVVNDGMANLGLVPTSPYASLVEKSGSGIEGGAKELTIDLTSLNADADTRMDEVFKIVNYTGGEVDVKVLDTDASVSSIADDGTNEWEDTFQVYNDNNPYTRLDDGTVITLGSGEQTLISLLILLRDADPSASNLPDKLMIIADGIAGTA